MTRSALNHHKKIWLLDLILLNLNTSKTTVGNIGTFFLQGELTCDKRQLVISYEELLLHTENTISQIANLTESKFNPVGNPYEREDVVSGMKGISLSITIGDQKLLQDNKSINSSKSDEWRQISLPRG